MSESADVMVSEDLEEFNIEESEPNSPVVHHRAYKTVQFSELDDSERFVFDFRKPVVQMPKASSRSFFMKAVDKFRQSKFSMQDRPSNDKDVKTNPSTNLVSISEPSAEPTLLSDKAISLSSEKNVAVQKNTNSTDKKNAETNAGENASERANHPGLTHQQSVEQGIDSLTAMADFPLKNVTESTTRFSQIIEHAPAKTAVPTPSDNIGIPKAGGSREEDPVDKINTKSSPVQLRQDLAGSRKFKIRSLSSDCLSLPRRLSKEIGMVAKSSPLSSLSYLSRKKVGHFGLITTL